MDLHKFKVMFIDKDNNLSKFVSFFKFKGVNMILRILEHKIRNFEIFKGGMHEILLIK